MGRGRFYQSFNRGNNECRDSRNAKKEWNNSKLPIIVRLLLAGAYPQSNKWVIGRFQNGTWTDSTTYTETINKNQDYQLRTEVSGTTVKLYVKETGAWTQKLTYDFGTLPAGDVGVTVEQSHTKFQRSNQTASEN